MAYLTLLAYFGSKINVNKPGLSIKYSQLSLRNTGSLQRISVYLIERVHLIVLYILKVIYIYVYIYMPYMYYIYTGMTIIQAIRHFLPLSEYCLNFSKIPLAGGQISNTGCSKTTVHLSSITTGYKNMCVCCV